MHQFLTLTWSFRPKVICLALEMPSSSVCGWKLSVDYLPLTWWRSNHPHTLPAIPYILLSSSGFIYEKERSGKTGSDLSVHFYFYGTLQVPRYNLSLLFQTGTHPCLLEYEGYLPCCSFPSFSQDLRGNVHLLGLLNTTMTLPSVRVIFKASQLNLSFNNASEK